MFWGLILFCLSAFAKERVQLEESVTWSSVRQEISSKEENAVYTCGVIDEPAVIGDDPINWRDIDGEPHVPFWSIQVGDLLTWVPGGSFEDAFCRSYQPLLSRNISFNKELPRVLICASNQQDNPLRNQKAQGYLGVDELPQVQLWNYIDVFVYFAGSTSEGEIVMPPPGIVRAAHKNGVKVVGSVFLAPDAFGGKSEYVEKVIQKNADGSYPYGDKLIEVAQYYGFDGWFFNYETYYEHEDEVMDFCQYVTTKSQGRLEFIFYEAGLIQIDSTTISTYLGDSLIPVTTGIMFDYGNGVDSDKSSAFQARLAGRNPFCLYAGVNMSGWSADPSFFSFYVNTDEPIPSISLALFAYHYITGISQVGANPNERQLWYGDGKSSYKGLSSILLPKKNIHTAPFITNFCTGNGLNYYVPAIVSHDFKDYQLGSVTWSSYALQDSLPLLEGMTESPYVYGRGVHSANSLALKEKGLYLLFDTEIIQDDTNLTLIAQTDHPVEEGQILLNLNQGEAEFSLSFEEGQTWKRFDISLSHCLVQHLTSIEIELTDSLSQDKNALYIGQVSCYGENQMPGPIRSLAISEGHSVDKDTIFSKIIDLQKGVNTAFYNLYLNVLDMKVGEVKNVFFQRISYFPYSVVIQAPQGLSRTEKVISLMIVPVGYNGREYNQYKETLWF